MVKVYSTAGEYYMTQTFTDEWNLEYFKCPREIPKEMWLNYIRVRDMFQELHEKIDERFDEPYDSFYDGDYI